MSFETAFRYEDDRERGPCIIYLLTEAPRFAMCKKICVQYGYESGRESRGRVQRAEHVILRTDLGAEKLVKPLVVYYYSRKYLRSTVTVLEGNISRSQSMLLGSLFQLLNQSSTIHLRPGALARNVAEFRPSHPT